VPLALAICTRGGRRSQLGAQNLSRHRNPIALFNSQEVGVLCSDEVELVTNQTGKEVEEHKGDEANVCHEHEGGDRRRNFLVSLYAFERRLHDRWPTFARSNDEQREASSSDVVEVEIDSIHPLPLLLFPLRSIEPAGTSITVVAVFRVVALAHCSHEELHRYDGENEQDEEGDGDERHHSRNGAKE